MTANPAGPFRIVMGLSIMAAMIVVGYLHRSPWIVALAAPVFTVLYALGKWKAWRLAWAVGGAGPVARAALATLPIQAVVAGVPYLMGLGLAAIAAAPAPMAALSKADALFAGGLLAFGAGMSALIIRIENAHGAPAQAFAAAADDDDTPAAEIELDVDPTPLTHETFFVSPAHWRQHLVREALEGRGKTIVKRPRAASEEMIAAAEAKLGIKLPATLRALYARMNGGYVGWLYVPLKPKPGPVFDDWRGAFSIDYSSLVAVDELRSVADRYEDFTHEPEDVPANADRLFVLQARYGDMTLLDYSRGPEPRVLLVDFDRHDGKDPVDAAFDGFDAFFAALRRVRVSVYDLRPARRDLAPPLSEVAGPDRARQFWGEAKPHVFAVNAEARKEGPPPKPAADDALIAETEARLGVKLPAGLMAFYRLKNGGGACYRFVEEIAADGTATDREAMRTPVPLEHLVSLAELSDRIVFPPGETPWKARWPDADKLIVLDGEKDDVLLLDYRGRPDGDPALLRVADLDADPPAGEVLGESVDALLLKLRFQRRGWDDVAKPLADAPGRLPE